MATKTETRARIVVVVLSLLAAVLAVMWLEGDIGTTKGGILPDARKNTTVPNEYPAVQSEAGKLISLMFYDPADPHGDNGMAMVYENRTGLYGGAMNLKLALGWKFRGSVPCPAQDGLVCYAVGAHGERVYFSANAEGIVRAEGPDGTAYTFDPDTALTLTAPEGVRFYDAAGSEVPVTDRGAL